MKKYIIILLSLILISFACKKESGSASVNPKIEISKGDKYFVSEHMSVSLDSVLNDSRCPSNVNCIWEGNAEVRFVYLNGTKMVKFSLNTNSSMRKDTLLDGYTIELVRLTPYPDTEKVIEQKDYKAELKIEKKAGPK
jgi:hypothetical protein